MMSEPCWPQTGVVRRAFRSRIDNTLQPYSIRPIAAPVPGRKYPVVVFLHGSASDDRNQLNGWQAMLPNLILVAPYARGISHFYTMDGAQEDIKEVLADVKQNNPVDPEGISLAGFSMGATASTAPSMKIPRAMGA
jgi:dipeptidyl aminopeptidase/acylaminoacyl peptidase